MTPQILNRSATLLAIYGTFATAGLFGQAPIITTIAGGGPNNVAATSTALRQPSGGAVDAQGNYYVAGETQVFRIDPAGHLTVVAGNGSFGGGGDGGPATKAGLFLPRSVALDGIGNMYIADTGNTIVRKVSLTTGIITTVAGKGGCSFGNTGGTLAVETYLCEPTGVAVESTGNVLISDAALLWRLSINSGILNLVAGTGTQGLDGDGGPASQALLDEPQSVRLDSAGNIYIADDDRIRKITIATGIITTIASGLNSPADVAIDSAGNVYIADTDNQAVRLVAAGTGIVTTVAGTGSFGFSGDGGLAKNAQLWKPLGLALDNSGNLFIADYLNYRVRKVLAANSTISTLAGSGNQYFSGGPATDAALNRVAAVASDSSGNLYMAVGNNVARMDATTGIVSRVAGTGDMGTDGDGGLALNATLDLPSSIALDGLGNLYFTETNAVRRIALGTGLINTIAGTGSGSCSDGGLASQCHFSFPIIATNTAGDLYISDFGSEKIYRIAAGASTISIIAGSGSTGFAGDGGLALNAQLFDPEGLAIDAAGNVYFADSSNNRIRRIDAVTKIITTIAGNGTRGSFGDGIPATQAALTRPSGVALDGAGNLYFSEPDDSNYTQDTGNRVRKVSLSTGLIQTVAGFSDGFYGDGGFAGAASLDDPHGIAFDQSGRLIVADGLNNKLRRITNPGMGTTVILASTPPGRTFTLQDFSFFAGTNYIAPKTFIWGAGGSQHLVSLSTPQAGPTGTMYVFDNWSDGGAQNHAITVPASDTTITANFRTQYLLSTSATQGGSITSSGWYDAGSVVPITATASFGSYFAGFSGDLTGTVNPQNITMNGPHSVVANFVPAPFLEIIKSHSGFFTQGQQNATYIVTVFNQLGWGTTNGTVTVTETLPAGMSLVSMSGAGWTCNANTCTRSDALVAGASYPVITVKVNVGFTAGTLVSNMVSVSGGQTANGIDTATDGTIILPNPPVLSISKTHSGNFTQGQPGATYFVTVSNAAGAGPSNGLVTVTETVPSGMTLVSMSGTGWSCATVPTCTRGDALAGGSSYPVITVTVNVSASAGTLQVNQASVSGGGSVTANAIDTTMIIANPAVLAIAKTHIGNFTQGQQNAAYTITVSNTAGKGPTTGTVTVTETVPSGMTLVSMSGTGWSCATVPTCTRSDALAGGSSYPVITVTVNVSASAGTLQVNQASVSGGSSVTANAIDTTMIIANPAVLAIAKTHIGNFTQGQQNAAYTITVSNTAGKGPTTGAVTVTETVPSGMTLVSMSGTGWSCATVPTCTRSDALAGGSSYPVITVIVNVASNATSPQVNQVSVAGGGSAAASANDSTTVTSPPAMSLSPMILSFNVSGSLKTSNQTVTLTFTGGTAVGWTASSNRANITVSPASGAGNATLQISASAGPSGVITVTAPGATNALQQILVNVTNVGSGNPFGSFDTPTNNTSGISGAVAVTGWALDNIEVTKVDIWREPVGTEPTAPNGLVYIGDAVFVAGARPDVQAANPNVPFNYRAGWGYLMLSTGLPPTGNATSAGNGTYKLHAIAHNAAGASTDLGTKAITVDNKDSVKPFGTIDTPDQGATISGNQFVNFGWALAQNPNCIPIDGSTLTVIVDGVALGSPTYNQNRSDLAGLFPGRCNSIGAAGYFFIDTTKLSNGVHTISWLAYDNKSNGDGLGSRFFNVLNTNASTAAAPEELVRNSGAVKLQRGYDSKRLRETLARDEDGRYRIEIEELDRIALDAGVTRGYLLVEGQQQALPAGSAIRGGVFYWQLAPAFFGHYDLVLDRPSGERLHVRIHVRSKT